MSGSEDEIYSTMFSSLKHPARRKILRMLAQSPMSFSQMLEELDVSSSHLTYHLESLGELLAKMEDGKYKLSKFGEASVNTMRGVEEAPSTKAGKLSTLPFKWKGLLSILIIVIIALASFSAVQFESINQLSKSQQTLQDNLHQMTTQNQQLLSWGTGTDKALSFIRNVAQLDLAKYQAALLSDSVQYREDLGGVLEETMKYALTSNESRIDINLRFRNNHFSKYQLTIVEGTPLYAQPQSSDALSAAKSLVERYRAYTSDSYLQDMYNLLAFATGNTNGTVLNNMKLVTTLSGSSAQVFLEYTENDVDFSGKSLWMVADGGIVTQLTDGWFLLNVGSTAVNISQDQAIQIAFGYVKNYSYTINGTKVSNIIALPNPISIQFSPHPRDKYLSLIPYWYVILNLDKEYPGGVTKIAVGIWADNGQVANVQTLA